MTPLTDQDTVIELSLYLHFMADKKENPYVKKTDDGTMIPTAEGLDLLAKITTDATGPVYAFNGDAPQLMIAAAMARLSRRGDDLRTIYLDEFATAGEDGAEALIDRVVTSYGDDSVQQLAPLSFVVEDASNLLTKRLEWGRIMAYLEQSTRYIFFDKKDQTGNFRYFTPPLPAPLAAQYQQAMDSMFEKYSEVVRGVTEYVRTKHPEPADPKERGAWLGATRAQACDAARPLLPVATKATVGIVGSAQAVESLIRHLLADPLHEAQETGRKILKESRKVIGAFLKRTDMPDRGLAWVLHASDTRTNIRNLAAKHSLTSTVSSVDSVQLLQYWPKHEDELIPDMLFEASAQPIAEIKKQVGGWSDETKAEVFAAYIGERRNRRHKPGRAFEIAHYEWEIVGDYGTFRDLQRHRMVDAWEWQDLTPHLGFEVPELISEAGFEQLFRDCFSLAEQLHHQLTTAGFVAEAQYATLLGHNMRYRFMMNARAAFHLLELRTSPQGHPGYRKICQEMHRKLSEVHPKLGAAMKFVNQHGDPELTRLEAERATQLKLQLLNQAEDQTMLAKTS